jgi:hypothetical protein
MIANMRSIQAEWVVGAISAALMLIAAPTGSAPRPAPRTSQAATGPVTYMDLERNSSITIAADGAQTFDYLPSSPRREAGKMLVVSAPVLNWMDCSSEVFLCVRSLETLAVPRSGLVKDGTYEVGGARFQVEECRFEHDGRCGAALVVAACAIRQVDDPSNAYGFICDPEAATDGAAEIRYSAFIFNPGVGVTAFGSSDIEPKSHADRVALAATYVLSTPTGLLYPQGKKMKAR